MNFPSENERLRAQLEETRSRLMNAMMLNTDLHLEVKILRQDLHQERSKKEMLKHLSVPFWMGTVSQFA